MDVYGDGTFMGTLLSCQVSINILDELGLGDAACYISN